MQGSDECSDDTDIYYSWVANKVAIRYVGGASAIDQTRQQAKSHDELLPTRLRRCDIFVSLVISVLDPVRKSKRKE